jgi:hypothetical protein
MMEFEAESLLPFLWRRLVFESILLRALDVDPESAMAKVADDYREKDLFD